MEDDQRGKVVSSLCPFTRVMGLWLEPVGLFAGECSFGFVVRGALAGRVIGPTFKARNSRCLMNLTTLLING